MPSEATAVGSRNELRVAATFSVTVVKSGCPSASVARPVHTGHLRSKERLEVGLGSIPDRFWKSRTRWFDGKAPTRLASATKRVSAAYARPLTPPRIVALE